VLFVFAVTAVLDQLPGVGRLKTSVWRSLLTRSPAVAGRRARARRGIVVERKGRRR